MTWTDSFSAQHPARPLVSRLARLAVVAVMATSFAGPSAAQAAGEDPPLEVTFQRPLPAITGSDYTIRPVWPAGFVFPEHAKCTWELRWGDDASIFERKYNDTYGEISFDRLAADGGCGEWTFTLPYSSALQYQLVMSYCEKSPTGSSYFCKAAPAPDSRASVFKAALGTTDRHIRRSTFPVAYILPSATTSIVGRPITYTLYGSEGFTPPAVHTGWSTSCLCSPSGSKFQADGRTFTFTPDAAGHWRVGWHALAPWWPHMGAYYDPVARLAETVRPVITAGPFQRPKPGAQVTTTIPMSLSWAGRDTGSGIDRCQLQQSRNGGAWTWLSLPTPLTTYVTRPLTPSGTYRYRVRAVDKAGNLSYWAYTNTVYPRWVSEASGSVAYSSGWSSLAVPGAIGGAVRRSGSSTASATYRFTGQNVAWVAAKGPGMGSARVYVDGVLVATVSLASSTSQPARIVFDRRWTVSGTHTLQIRPVGNGPVNIDTFIRFG